MAGSISKQLDIHHVPTGFAIKINSALLVTFFKKKGTQDFRHEVEFL
jgi:hypothetical protein